MLRESLVSLIYNKALNMNTLATDTSKAVTLMSTDVDSVAEVAEQFHEAWGKAIELTIGMIMLARQVKWIWPLPMVLIFRTFVNSLNLTLRS